MYQNQTQVINTMFQEKRKWPIRAITGIVLLGMAALIAYGYRSGAFFADSSAVIAQGPTNSASSRTSQMGTEAVTGANANSAADAASRMEQARELRERTFAQFNQGIDVQGRIVPVLKAELSVADSGIVSQLLVQEGDEVSAGQVLLKLESTRAEADILRAEAQLQQARANAERLKNSVRPSDLLAAQASVDAAKARIEQLQNGSSTGAIAAAQASVAAAQAAKQRLFQGPNQSSVAAAQAELENAQQFRDDAQRAYDKVAWRNDIGTLPESANLQQATNSYNAAKARLDALYVGASAADSAQADANIQRSQAELDAIRASLPAQVLEAEANLRLFEAQLLRLQEGVMPEEIAVAEAEVRAAEVTLKQARSALEARELRAPFDGVIAIVNATIGEHVSPSENVMRLADLSQWEIETSNLTEIDVLGITSGEEVSMTFDALPDETMNGIVKYVRPFGESVTGETVYKVVISPETHDNRFLWNMSSYVTFNEQQ